MTDIEKLKALAPATRVEACIAAAMEKYAGGSPGRDLAYYQNVHQDLAPLARELERQNDELRAEVQRLHAEKEQAAQDSFALAWAQALSDAAFYVTGHCANGEHHAEIIMEMVAPKLTVSGTAPAAGTDKDAAMLDWLDQNIFHREMDDWDKRQHPDHWMWVTFAPKGVQGTARNILDAAIGAHTGEQHGHPD